MVYIRLPNGYGSVYKLSGNRRNPFVARKTTGFNDKGHPVYQIIGYYVDRKTALLALAEHNKNPLAIDNNTITFKELFNIYKAVKYADATKSTINGYNSAFNNSESLHDMKFKDIKTSHLDDAIIKCDLGHGTKKKMKILYSQLYEYAMANDIVNKDYSEYVTLGENKDKAIRIPFSQQEIKVLFEKEPNIPFVDTILILIYTGIRPGELLNLRPDDINLPEKYFIVTDSKTEAGENRLVPINEKILPFFERRAKAGHPYLLMQIFSNKIKQMSYDYYYRGVFQPIMEQLGMSHRPHDCRHTFATLLNNAEANRTSIKDLIGHSSFMTTEKIYTHKDIEELRKAINLI